MKPPNEEECKFHIVPTSIWHDRSRKSEKSYISVYCVRVTCHHWPSDLKGECEEFWGGDDDPTDAYIEDLKTKAYEDMVEKAKSQYEVLKKFFGES